MFWAHRRWTRRAAWPVGPPLTAAREVDYIVTELCVLHYDGKGLVLEELAPGVTVEDVLAKTEAELMVPNEIRCMV